MAALCGLTQLAGAAGYTWNVTSGNWSVPGSWTPSTSVAGPLAVDSAVFGTTDASTASNSVNNVVDAGFAGSVSNLTYNSVSATPFIYNVTQIPSGKTLTVTTRLLVGGLNEPAAGGPFLSYGILTGGGTLMITGTNLAVENYGSAAAANTFANFDLSGLSNFVFKNTNGTISIADTTLPQTSGTVNVRAGGNLVLAGVSNSISVQTINLATCTAPQGGPTSTLFFGAGTNIINVGTINIANNKNPGNALFAASTGGLRIRGVSGTATSRANITIGNRNVGSGTGATPGQMLLNGHPLDILANSLIVGEVSVTAGPSGTAGQSGNGNLQFDTGTIDATSVVMALNSAPNAAGGISGTIDSLTVGANATLRVGTGGLSLINQTASNVCSSVLTISNGAVVCTGNITAVTNAAAGTGFATATNIINIIGGGSLTLGAGSLAGTANSPIGQLNLDTNSTLRFVSPPPGQPAIVVNTLTWPAIDSALTLVVSNLPATAHIGTTIPLIQFATLVGGTFTAPAVSLPAGVTGGLSLSGNTVVLTITSSVYPSLSTTVPAGLTTFATNTALTTTASSSITTITNVQVVVSATTLGGPTITVTNALGSPGLTVTGIGTATANISYALATNTIYLSTTVTITDANGRSVSLSTPKFDTLVPVLVIEAADFNYSSGSFLDTPADGGLALFLNQVGTEGIDEHKAVRAGAKSYYRPGDAVVIQPANPGLGTPPSLTEQKFVTAAANGNTTDVELEVGFNTPGDWFNYTRTYGAGGSAPAGLYNVWCYLATSGSGVQASLSEVTSDPTQGSQTTNFLGNFGTAAFSDTGYNNYVYVPLVDQYGNRATIGLTNAQTLKVSVTGNPNIAFYLLVPVAPVLTPTLLQVYPDGTAQFQTTNHFSATIGPAQGTAINTNGIHLVLNGSDVTAGLTLSPVGGGVWTVSYPIPPNFVYTVTVTATNLAGLSTSFTTTFDTFSLTNFQWEAVDYDYSTNNGTGDGGWSGGLFIDNAVPSGNLSGVNGANLATNSYFLYPGDFTVFADGYGAVAQQWIDVNYTNAAGIQHNYRADTVGSEITTDFLRPKFLVSQTNFNDTTICTFDLGWFNLGDWVNYTRTYPGGKYNVWGRLAGGVGAFSGTTLSQVTSGVGTSNQTTQVLGSFADAAPAGWQAWHWIPLLDANGNQVVIQPPGKATLRLTSGNNLNVEFFMLTPATTPAAFNVAAAPVGGQMQISFPTQIAHNYTVWFSSSLLPASWTQVGAKIAGDGLVHVIPQSLTADQGYYRVIAQ
ncbi:MAG: hypothetical protein P4N60_21515 [Verrucomicrobiae bacterium]|nr:hypothetical protein [Verrucomicrobiae bacterium]